MKTTAINKVMIFTTLLSSYNLGLKAQGIRFETNLSWTQIKEKAKAENKGIFIDCYATWCGPCKQMDADVYDKKEAGDLFNAKFISIKAQMDRTANDNSHIKAWYNDAETIRMEYQVTTLPTYLFFNRKGELVHRGGGYLPVKPFLDLAAEALDPLKQFYSLLKQYQAGKKFDRKALRDLILKGEETGATKVILPLAVKYKKTYLDVLSFEHLANKDNMDFIMKFPQLITSKDKFFTLFTKHADLLHDDQKEFAYSTTIRVIWDAELKSKLYKADTVINQNPDWQKYYIKIATSYGQRFADALILPTRLQYLEHAKSWPAYASLQDSVVQSKIANGQLKGEQDAFFALNLPAWNCYLNSNDVVVLKIALKWAEQAINMDKTSEHDANPQIYDTKARLLYKLGKREEAITTQEHAVELDRQDAISKGNSRIIEESVLYRVLMKMKNGESISDKSLE